MNASENLQESNAENPYEAPRAAIAKLVGNPKLEQTIAKRLLEARDQGGYSIGLFLRWQGKRYVIMGIYFAILLGLCAFAQAWLPFGILAGLMAGSALRDLGWYKASIKAWPFNDRVFRWDLIEQIADGEI
jgi:hypothetical protein